MLQRGDNVIDPELPVMGDKGLLTLKRVTRLERAEIDGALVALHSQFPFWFFAGAAPAANSRLSDA